MKRAVIVGGGIIGLCSAYELLKRGYTITVLDRCFTDGCSYGNGGIIVPSHFVPIASPGMLRLGLKMMLDKKSPFGLSEFPDWRMLAWIMKFVSNSNSRHVATSSELLKSLNLRSKALYEIMLGDLDTEVGFEKRGLLMTCKTQKAFEEELALSETATRLGLETKVWAKEDFRRMEPDLEIVAEGGVWFEDDAHLTPRLLMESLKTYLMSRGVQFVKATVTRLLQKGRIITSVQSSEGEIGGDFFVLSAGVWTSALAQSLALNLPMLSGRGYGFTMPLEAPKLRHPAILVESRIAVTPMMGGMRFVGAMELGHAKDRPITTRLTGMVDAIPTYYPILNSQQLASLPVWTGHRPCTPDGLPYLGKSSKLDNAIWACGHAMMGMSMGPISGKIVAQLAETEELDISLKLVSPDRYAK